MSTTKTARRQCGYVCKRCGAPSPMGVGYTSYAAGAAAASRGLESCACGYSVDPRVLISGGYTVAAPADGTRPPVIIAQVRRVQL